MEASVILPTRNRSEFLQRCLVSLTEQNIPLDGFEVVVVDNGSTDNTRAVVESFSHRLQLQYKYAPEPGLHVGRHEGMRTAKSDILIYGDDDIEATQCWVSSIIEVFNDPSVAMVGGNNYPAYQKEPPDWLRQMWDRPVYKGRALGYLSILDFGQGRFDIDPRYIWGCNFSIRRNVLLQAGGFHPDGMPKEKMRYRGDGETHVSSFARDHRMRAVFDSGASVYHSVTPERMTRNYFKGRAYSQGVSDSYTYHRNKSIPKTISYLMRRHLGNAVTMVRSTISSMRKDVSVTDAGAYLFQVNLRQAYWDGFDYHRRELRADSTLQEWIKKESYF